MWYLPTLHSWRHLLLYQHCRSAPPWRGDQLQRGSLMVLSRPMPCTTSLLRSWRRHMYVTLDTRCTRLVLRAVSKRLLATTHACAKAAPTVNPMLLRQLRNAGGAADKNPATTATNHKLGDVRAKRQMLTHNSRPYKSRRGRRSFRGVQRRGVARSVAELFVSDGDQLHDAHETDSDLRAKS